MTLWQKTELLQALSADIVKHNLNDEINIDEVVIDSRKAIKKSLFFALKGPNHDAHSFLNQVFANGCNLAIIHNEDNFKKFSSSHNLILVKDSFESLYSLAKFSRNRSQAKIIAITGSVGKTTTKEILKTAFSSQGKTFTTPGNLNNHIGLPLSLNNFAKDCDYGIFEMGMNHLNEIKPLSLLTRPHLAIVTNVEPVHIENFKDEQEIALAKSEIFAGLLENGSAIINADNKHSQFLSDQAQGYNINYFGSSDKSDYQLLDITHKNLEEVVITAKAKDKNISYSISNQHEAYITSSLIALTCLDLLNCDLKTGLKAIKNIEIGKGRGQIQSITIDNKEIIIIDDSYNASLASMKSGLEYAVKLKNSLNKKRVIAALGDMLELGQQSQRLHQEVLNLTKTLKIDKIVLVGDEMKLASSNMDKNIYKSFCDTQNACLVIPDILNDQDILYIKGSRGMQMERIIESIKS